ncbi:endonuclease/exonuclease/phosphatase family protein [Microbacterium chocolatum]|uniref:endonuclease/exonuclease/phosphatase family protein n=1 Tax=Microbacterium aurantiacum TaxID=162393 RepID=UPI0033905524
MGLPVIGPVPAPGIHVMTFNIRRRSSRPGGPVADRWERRRALVAELLRTERPAVVGIQEAMPDQADAVGLALGETYRRLGRGREREGRGEGCPIFVDTARFDILAHRQEALSETPEVAGSRGWFAAAPRTAVVATLRDRVTGAVCEVINTHFDHVSPLARVRSAEQIRRMVIAGGRPAVVLGDLNAGAGSRPLRVLLGDGVLSDAWTRAAERRTPEWGTRPNYRRPRPDGRRIDWLLVGGGSRDGEGIEVDVAAINGEAVRGRWPSDHLPVQAVLRLPPPSRS